MLFVSLLTIAAAAVSASPVERRAPTVVLPLKQHTNVSSMKNIVSKGQARIQKINANPGTAARAVQVSSGPITNEDVSYIAPVVIGGTSYDLIVDTGCKLPPSDTLVGNSAD